MITERSEGHHTAQVNGSIHCGRQGALYNAPVLITGAHSLDDTLLLCNDSVNANIEQNPHTLEVVQDHQSDCSL